MRNSRHCRVEAIAITMPDGRLMPEPPPSVEICDAIRRNTSATTQGRGGEWGAGREKHNGGGGRPPPRRNHARDWYREERMQPANDGGREQHIAAEADIGLLPDRDQAGIAG